MDKDLIKSVTANICRFMPESGLTYEESMIALRAAMLVLEKISAETNVAEINTFLDSYVTAATRIQEAN
jgi:hypothetical protein